MGCPDASGNLSPSLWGEFESTSGEEDSRSIVAETLEQSDYTSVELRVQAIKATALDAGSCGELPTDVERAALESATP
jgi:hypothetical protein